MSRNERYSRQNANAPNNGGDDRLGNYNRLRVLWGNSIRSSLDIEVLRDN